MPLHSTVDLGVPRTRGRLEVSEYINPQKIPGYTCCEPNHTLQTRKGGGSTSAEFIRAQFHGCLAIRGSRGNLRPLAYEDKRLALPCLVLGPTLSAERLKGRWALPPRRLPQIPHKLPTPISPDLVDLDLGLRDRSILRTPWPLYTEDLPPRPTPGSGPGQCHMWAHMHRASWRLNLGYICIYSVHGN